MVTDTEFAILCFTHLAIATIGFLVAKWIYEIKDLDVVLGAAE